MLFVPLQNDLLKYDVGPDKEMQFYRLFSVMIDDFHWCWEKRGYDPDSCPNWFACSLSVGVGRC